MLDRMNEEDKKKQQTKPKDLRILKERKTPKKNALKCVC